MAKLKNLKKKILILNGSPQGPRSNSRILIQKLIKELGAGVQTKCVHLAEQNYSQNLKTQITEVDGLIFVSGTYWDSWGSPLQEFLEKATALEGTKAVVGKPCAVFILMHSVGGKSVLSRLQGVLSTLGFLIPPMSGMVYSSLSHRISKSSPKKVDEDIWHLNDVKLILSNLKLSLEIQKDWACWPVDRKNFERLWLK